MDEPTSAMQVIEHDLANRLCKITMLPENCTEADAEEACGAIIQGISIVAQRRQGDSVHAIDLMSSLGGILADCLHACGIEKDGAAVSSMLEEHCSQRTMQRTSKATRDSNSGMVRMSPIPAVQYCVTD